MPGATAIDRLLSNKPCAYVFFASSLARASARQTQPCFNSRSDADKECEAWREYFGVLWTFRDALTLPNAALLLCEDGQARTLKALATGDYIGKAASVLGWEARQ